MAKEASGSRTLTQVFEGLLETSTLHGLPKIVSSKHPVVKVLWLLLFISTAVILGLQIDKLHTQFRSHPIQTSIGLAFSVQPYPSVSVCNMNPARSSVLRQHNEELNIFKSYEDEYDAENEDDVYYNQNVDYEDTVDYIDGVEYEDDVKYEINVEYEHANDYIESLALSSPNQTIIDSPMNISFVGNISSDNYTGVNISDYANSTGVNISDYANSTGVNISDYANSTGVNISDYANSTGVNISDYTVWQFDSDTWWDTYHNQEYEYQDNVYADFDYGVWIEESHKDRWEHAVDNLKYTLASQTASNRRRFGHQKDKFLHRVTYRGRVQNTSDYKTFLTFDYGNCYTVQSEKFYAYTSGTENALKLTLNLETDEYLPNFADGYGVRVVFHAPGTYPMPDDEGITINPGHETSIGLRMINVTRLGEPYGRCNDDKAFQEEYNVTYTMNACLEFCRIKTIMELCLCRPLRAPDIDAFRGYDLPVCNKSDSCEMIMLELFQKPIEYCQCTEPCSEVVYSLSQSYRRWPNDEYLKNVLMKDLCHPEPCHDPTHGEFDFDKNRRNFAQLVIYFESLNYEVLSQSPLYEWPRFLSDIGGTMGLFTGASVLSVVEFVQLFLELCNYVWSRVKRRPVATGTNAVV